MVYGLFGPLRGHARSHRCCANLESGAIPVGAGVPAKRPAQTPKLLVPVASAIIPNIMVSPIISAMPYTVGLAHVVIRFVIRLMIGFVIGFVIGFMICFVVGLVVGAIISTLSLIHI